MLEKTPHVGNCTPALLQAIANAFQTNAGPNDTQIIPNGLTIHGPGNLTVPQLILDPNTKQEGELGRVLEACLTHAGWVVGTGRRRTSNAGGSQNAGCVHPRLQQHNNSSSSWSSSCCNCVGPAVW